MTFAYKKEVNNCILENGSCSWTYNLKQMIYSLELSLVTFWARQYYSFLFFIMFCYSFTVWVANIYSIMKLLLLLLFLLFQFCFIVLLLLYYSSSHLLLLLLVGHLLLLLLLLALSLFAVLNFNCFEKYINLLFK